jgi:ABC-2 type transport system ATP-binding protein
MVIMVDGQVLATGTPADIRGHARVPEAKEPTMEDSFVAIVEDYRLQSEE